MSRIWKLPISVENDVSIDYKSSKLTVKWPKWQLNLDIPEWVILNIDNSVIKVSVKDDSYKNFWWLFRSLIYNMVYWVTKWYEVKLLILWVWYNVKVQWDTVILNLWYSHPINYKLPIWVSAKTEKDSKWADVLVVEWIDKQKVWETASKIRSLRLPEPYKWKWIRYLWEQIKLKVWKTAKK